VTILNNKAKTLAFVSLLVQLNNKQSINLITSLCWSYFSRRNYFRVIHITLSPKSKLFLAALQVTGSQQTSSGQADRTTERATTLHYHYHYYHTTGESTRQQHSGSNNKATRHR
jgi:hypothetical protein